MKIKVISVGKVKESYFKDAIDEYSKRIKKFATFEKQELTDEKITDSIPDEQIKQKEGDKILKALSENSFKFILSERGKSITSEKFSDLLKEVFNTGINEVNFVIGGALGLDENVVKKADYHLSLSAMTLPHQMAQMFLLEQIYRSFKIMNNEPYHK